MIRSSVANDEVTSWLNDLSSKLTTEALIELNQASQLDRENPEVLAQRWLSNHGYWQGSRSPVEKAARRYTR